MKPRTYKLRRHYTHLGAYLQKARERAGLTQRDVSLELNYSSAQFISNFERGIAMPPVKKLKFLVKRYNIPLSRVTTLALEGEASRFVEELNN